MEKHLFDKNGVVVKIGDTVKFPYSLHKLVEIDGIVFLERSNDGELDPNVESVRYAELRSCT